MSNTRRSLLIVIIFNLVAAAVYGGGVYYLTTERNNVELLISESEDLEQKRVIVQEMRRDHQEFGSALDNIDRHFLSSDEEATISFFETIENLASESGVIFEKNISANTAEYDTGEDKELEYIDVERLIIATQVRGGWIEVQKFLSLAENLPFKLETEKAQISKRITEEGSYWIGNFRFAVVKIVNN